jgi:hypothetical protein
MRRALARALSALRGGPPPDPQEALAAGAFDRDFYLATYPDVAASGVDPLAHFMTFGWREGRDPSPRFSTTAYLQAFPDAAEAGINPFLDHLRTGRYVLPPAEPPEGFRHPILEHLVPVGARRPPPAPALSSLDLAAELTISRDGLKRLHITFSHDDFSVHLGGLQLSIRREAARLAELGRDHLHIHPARAWQTVRTADEPYPLGVVWNGRPLGVFSADAIIAALAAVAGSTSDGRSFAIHSLLGHTADETADILAAAGLSQGVFWLHDFASLCAGFHLLRDDVEDCAAPPLDSAACAICLYGPWRARHLAEHLRLFERLALTVASPSQTALDLWTDRADVPVAGAVVLPHARLVARGPAPLPAANRPLRVAHLGFTAAHKGWPIFRRLAITHAFDPRYAFHHLGAGGDPELPVTFASVSVDADRPGAMTEALLRAEIDAVVIWPLCQETFSLVAYEAVAAGCAVITGPDSGNVAAFVRETGHGRVLDDEAALADAFAGGDILQLARAQRKPMLYDLELSALSLDLRGSPLKSQA